MREMKDSGVEWIGEIPKIWDLVQLGSLFAEHKHKNIGMQSDNLLSLSYGNIIRKDINTSDGLLPESFEGYNVIDDGDIVLRLTDLQNDQRSLRVGLSHEKGIVTSAYVTLRRRNTDMDSKFYYYLIHSYDICKGFYGMGAGVRQGLNYTGVRKIMLTLPSVGEQHRIVEFLEKKITNVDTLIGNVQKQIEKLKAYKQSLITEVVTKGLNHTVSMEDSGVDWIGKMPMSWCLIRLKYLLSVKSGDAIRNELLSDEGVVPVYGGGEMIGYTSNANVPEGSILIGRVGARCGCITLPEGMAWATDNALIVNSTVNRKYLYYLLMASNLNRLNTSNAQPLITGGKIREATVPFTVLDSEQLEIVNYLDDKCKCIDKLIAIKQSKIEKLEQYKRSIIYEYVTGKKEVS